jgi:hypothetical protein
MYRSDAQISEDWNIEKLFKEGVSERGLSDFN